MTLKEIEHAYAAGLRLEAARHPIEPPPLGLLRTFYPFGYPVEVRTNAEEVFENYEQMWGAFQQRLQVPPIRCDVSVTDGDAAECPPEPSYHLLDSQLVFVADSRHYTVSDLLTQQTRILITRGVLRWPLYVRYFLLMAPLAHISTAHAAPVHGACVAIGDRGVLLCGDSGAGKSTLAYACARAGWTYISDDASYAQIDANDSTVLGNCYQIRFRPEAAALFPEISGLPVTPRAAGKPSIEIGTHTLGLRCKESISVEAIVFLKRRCCSSSGGSDRHESATIEPYSRELARLFLQHNLFGPRSTRTAQNATIDRLLSGDVYQMRYLDLDDAVQQLRTLLERGR